MKFHTINVYLVFLVCAIVSSSSTDRVAFASVGNNGHTNEDRNNNNNNDESCKEEESVYVSPECAVVLVTAGSVAGGLASFVLVAPLLSLIGFTGAGVAKGSFAAWWQSTMPNGVMAGSISSSLQSIAMRGIASTIVISSSIGGAATASQLRRICATIDDVDPESKEGKVISSLLMAEDKIGTTWKQHVKPNLEYYFVPSEETKKMWQSDVKDMKDAFSDTWNRIKDQRSKDYWETGMNDLKDTVSDTWNKIKDRRSED
jgi:hypothetical protein